MRAIPIEVREAIVRCYYKVKSIHQVCDIFNVSKSTALSFVRKSKIGVSLEPSKKTQPSQFTEEHRQCIINWARHPNKASITVSGIILRFRKHYGMSISHRTVRRYLKSDKLSFKRLYYVRRQSKASKFRRHRLPFKQQTKIGVRGDRILSLDETGWRHGPIHPSHSWSRRGHKYRRAYRSRPALLRPSMICLIDSRRGIVDYDVLFGRAWNSHVMANFLRRALIGFRGYHVIMDNVSFHHSSCVKQVLKDMGVTPLYIDPYTPQQNPIEELFSPVKSYIAARTPSTAHVFLQVLRRSLCRRSIFLVPSL